MWLWHWAQARGDAEPCARDAIDAVDHGLDAELLGLDAALHVDHGIPEEARGDALVEGRVRQEVAGELLDGELVEGLVLVQRSDHPVAPRPDAAGAVLLEAVGVGVACGVEPPTAPAFAVMGRGEQPLHDPLVGAGGLVGDECIHLLGRGREAGEVEAEATEEGGAVGLGGGLK